MLTQDQRCSRDRRMGVVANSKSVRETLRDEQCYTGTHMWYTEHNEVVAIVVIPLARRCDQLNFTRLR